jgi:hypothetical protein
MRLVSEQDVLHRILEDIKRHEDSEDTRDIYVVLGLKLAYADVLMSPTEGRKK